ncbi:MAG: DUF4019 domain-containing protein [Elusimicrobiota bacterium]|nr:DUF4019 domain-containing protein [Elusimicrobiota bacterium]
MNILKLFTAGAISLLVSGCGDSRDTAVRDKDSSSAAKNIDSKKSGEAIEAAADWLQLADSGQYGRSWEEAAEYFKNLVSKEKWINTLKGVRGTLNPMIKREVQSRGYTTSMPGAPDGEYVIIHYETEFENKEYAIEAVTAMKEKDGNWRVSDYFIK